MWVYNCFIIFKYKYRENVSSYFWVIILNNVAKKDIEKLGSSGIKATLMRIALVSWKKKSNIKINFTNTRDLKFTNIRGLCSNFIEHESFLESNCLKILALCETNLNDSIDSVNFSVSGCLPLIRKDYFTYAWSSSLCLQGFFFAWDLSLENSKDSYLYFRLNLCHSVSYFFFLYRSPSSFSWTVFDAI